MHHFRQTPFNIPSLQYNMSAKKSDIFWTYPGETESGETLIITGHDGLDSIREAKTHIYRVRASLDYDAFPDGMPTDTAAETLEKITDALLAETSADPAAVITGIYTGAGRRDWIFYTRSLHIFRKIFNRALDPFPTYPFELDAEEDSDWTEYLDMKAATYIPDEE